MVLMLTYSTRQDSVKRMLAEGRNEELYMAHERVYEMVASRQTGKLYEAIWGTYFIDDDFAPAPDVSSQ